MKKEEFAINHSYRQDGTIYQSTAELGNLEFYADSLGEELEINIELVNGDTDKTLTKREARALHRWLGEILEG